MRFNLGIVAIVGLITATTLPAANAPRRAEANLQATLAWQLALEAEGFSPGLIDGRTGAKTKLATKEFQRSRGLSETGELDDATAAALRLDLAKPPLREYTVSTEDITKVAPTPKSWLAKAKAKYLGYSHVAEAVAERFHCSQGLLQSLNRGRNLARLKVGDVVTVPAIATGKAPRVHHLEVNLAHKAIRGYTRDGKQVALFHCSIAAKVDRRPKGEARVLAVANDPVYLFDPAMWREVKGIKQKLRIPPGPKNPVGLCWIGLSLKGYGIHGTPNPELIGKTGSHGCLRLTNWDAVRLGKMVAAGTPVKFVR